MQLFTSLVPRKRPGQSQATCAIDYNAQGLETNPLMQWGDQQCSCHKQSHIQGMQATDTAQRKKCKSNYETV